MLANRQEKQTESVSSPVLPAGVISPTPQRASSTSAPDTDTKNTPSSSSFSIASLSSKPFVPRDAHTESRSPKPDSSPSDSSIVCLDSFFVSEDLKDELLERIRLEEYYPPSKSDQVVGLPEMIYSYHSLFRFEDTASRNPLSPSRAFGVPTTLYFAYHPDDDCCVLLREFSTISEVSSEGGAAADAWKSIEHPSIATVKSVFFSSEILHENRLYIAVDYKPGAKSILRMCGGDDSFSSNSLKENESIAVSAVSQILGAINYVHDKGLLLRKSLDPSKVVLYPSSRRFFLSSVGVEDIIGSSGPKLSREEEQENDFRSLGRLALIILTSDLKNWDNEEALKTLPTLEGRISLEFFKLLNHLLSPTSKPNDRETLQVAAPLILQEMTRLIIVQDALEIQLQRELHNGRIFRVLSKLNFVLTYSSTCVSSTTQGRNLVRSSENDVLKAFRDFMFALDDNIADLPHVIECLNKLDAGSDERVALVSENQSYIFVVTFSEVKSVLNDVFERITET